jgi:enoyl-CoA hydratase
MAVHYETKEHLAIITLDRPEARNAVNREVAEGIEAALDRYEADPWLWAAIFTSTGPVFSAGADLKEIAAGNMQALFTTKGGFAGLVRRERVKPLIAAVNGPALAGGCEIALACDLVVAADTAMFGVPEAKRSLIAAAGGAFRLPHAVGRATAMEMVMTGDPITAVRAYQLGFINLAVPPERLMLEATELAERIIANAPLAVQEGRRIADRAFAETDETLWRLSEEGIARLSKTEDFQEGPRAFVEKRSPVWKGR